ncbi:Flp family type IVb pilin [Proteiniclasticum sp. SCR006]|uniref:Flp family type IVb pilin n=1 Tax=Proteiniclasticum aestuarii TaxID=2817862 RepID=A0A939HET3_9CLOT|nr:Flp family type IVb pilin [Proteiniclasticum aestuarii]MBO1265988.1 Flp family type IVb pilin [Proteiniclasticum aestuarii]
MEMLKRLWNDEEGQGMVEYGLIIALVAIVAIVGLKLVGDSVGGIFNDVSAELESPSGS